MLFSIFLQFVIILYFYLFGVILVHYLVESMELFVLKTTYNRKLTEFRLEPHYPWYLTAVRHFILIGFIWMFVWYFHVTSFAPAFAYQILFIAGAVIFSSILATTFWYVTSYKIDRAFHHKRRLVARQKRVCYLRVHRPLQARRYRLMIQLLYFLSAILLLLGTAVWYHAGM